MTLVLAATKGTAVSNVDLRQLPAGTKVSMTLLASTAKLVVDLEIGDPESGDFIAQVIMRKREARETEKVSEDGTLTVVTDEVCTFFPVNAGRSLLKRNFWELACGRQLRAPGLRDFGIPSTHVIVDQLRVLKPQHVELGSEPDAVATDSAIA